MKILTEEEGKADKDGINSFCLHIGTILRKLPPNLRVEAKTKVFNLLAEYELRSINQSSIVASLPARDANNCLQSEESTEYDNNYFFTSM